MMKLGLDIASSIVLFCFMMLICAPNRTSADLSSTTTKGGAEELLSHISTGNTDRILESINTIKQRSYQGDVLPLLRDLWEGRKNTHPNVRWEVIDKPIVKVALVDVLAQAARNGKVEVDKKVIRDYVTKFIDSQDVDLARRSIFVLGLLDEEQDVATLAKIAKKQDKNTFRTTIMALVQMCNPSANRALDDIKREISDTDLKSYTAETRSSWEDFKRKTGWCGHAL